MRSFMPILFALTLGACTAPAPQTEPPAAAAPFVVPMDPGTIACAELSNPAARTVATQWAAGQARAAVLSGRLDAAPDDAVIARALVDACGNDPSRRVRAAVAQIGI